MTSNQDQTLISVPPKLLARTITALEMAEENARELLAEHDASLGRTTRKNRYTAELYEYAIRESAALRQRLERILGTN